MALGSNDRQFRFNWRVTTFSVIFLTVFVNLGLWQMDRSKEKEEIMAEQLSLKHQLPARITELAELGNLTTGYPVVFEGQWLTAPILLLDNVVLEGKVGYEVLTLVVRGEQTVLVNRGFVPMKDNRSELPDIPLLLGDRVEGEVYPGEVNLMIDGAIEEMAESVIRIQRVDTEMLSQHLNMNIVPVVIRLVESHPDALPRYWPMTNMLPEKHTGYAIQWFLMAAAVLVAWFFFSFPSRAATSVE